MANNNEEQAKLTAKPAEKLPLSKTPKSAKSPLERFSFSALVTAIIALILTFYTMHAHHQAQQVAEQQTQHLNQEIAQLKQQQSTSEKNLDTAKTSIEQSQAALQNQMQAVNNDVHTVTQQHLYQTQDWLLLKARYFLELAQINAYWSDIQDATIALLQETDALLQNIPEQPLLNVRQAIAQEIVQLQGIPKIDRAGLLSQLNALENAMTELPIKQPLESSIASSEKNSSLWQQKLKESMVVLEKLIVVRRNDEDIQPLLSPLHQTLLRDSIRFNLQEAQWAILHNNLQIYQTSLNQALNKINDSFDDNTPATQAMVKQLTALQQEKLETAKPKLDQSLLLLNQFIESRNTSAPNTSTKEGGKVQ